MQRRLRYGLGAFAVAAILSGIGIGIALAGEGPATPAATVASAQGQTVQEDFLARLAARLGVSEERLRIALQATLVEELEDAAARGLLPGDLVETLRELVESGMLLQPPEGTSGEDRELPPILREIHGEIEALERQVAAFFGTTEARLREMLGEGKSLGEIADSFGKSRDELSRLLLTEFMAFLEDERVPAPLRDLARTFAARLLELYINGDLSLEGVFGGVLPWTDKGR
jgi:hypothetical protein